MQVIGQTESSSSVAPFLKWPGGKRWACPVIVPLIRKFLQRTYREPFVGGGAVYFALLPDYAVLSDVNPEIINAYRQVRSRYKALISELQHLPVDPDTYYSVRGNSNLPSSFARAVRFLYLNRTAFGGIYRVNQQGQFNVPFGGGGRTPEILWKRGILKGASEALSGISLKVMGFENALEEADCGDVVYCDPTYTVTHNNNGFVRYNERQFTWSDQKRLAELSKAAAAKGATVLVSNAHHEEIRKLYRPYREVVLTRSSLVARDPTFRRSVHESLFIVTKL